MNIRIPPSINWLVKKHALKQYELNKLITQIKLLETQKEKLEQELNALGTVIEMHEVPIEPKDIPPVKVKYRKLLNLKHGLLTSSIYKCLRLNESNKPLSISEVAYFVGIDLKIVQLDFEVTKRLRTAVRYRLKALAYSGKIKRINKGTKEKDSTYLLK